jgi:capsular exopolysaccharide synthesis family protein
VRVLVWYARLRPLPFEVSAQPPPTAPASSAGTPTFHDYVATLLRRKWIVIAVLVLVPVGSVAVGMSEKPVYEGSAEVLLGHLDLATSLTGVPDQTPALQPERVTATQAQLARVPEVARLAMKSAGVKGSVDEFLRMSSVTQSINTDILDFNVRNTNRALASRLATAYARVYTRYRRGLDTAALTRALSDVQRRIDQLRSSGQDHGALYASLVANQQKLNTMEALETSNAFVVDDAQRAVKVKPKPTRLAALGIGLGLILGIGLAFLVDSLDTRVRTIEEIGSQLGLPLLARVSERRRGRSPLVMLDDPNGPEAEAFRVLRTSLDFANLRQHARTIMGVSAQEGEGKSEVIANLALAFARSGRHVTLIDLDFRNPTLDHLFELSGRRGITDLALGEVALDDVLVPVDFNPGEYRQGTNGSARRGHLEVIPVGTVPPDAGEFVATHALSDVLLDLAIRADIVLIDAPALLRVSDAIVLSGNVEAMFVVVRCNVVRRPVLKELRRVLDGCPSPRLGFVATGVETDLGYGYSPSEPRLPRARQFQLRAAEKVGGDE